MPLPAYTPWRPEVLAARRRSARRVRQQPLVAVAVVMAAGILADRLTHLSAEYWWLLAVFAMLGSRRYARHRAVWLMFGIACGGAAWHHWHWSLYPIDTLARRTTIEAEPIALEVTVRSSPVRTLAVKPSAFRALAPGDGVRIAASCEAVRNGANWEPASGNIMLIVEGLPAERIARGDRLRVFGQCNAPRTATNPGEFDYAQHARGERLVAIVASESPACIERLSAGSFVSMYRQVDRLRSHWQDMLWQNLEPRTAALSTALLLGCEGTLPREDSQAYRTTGSTHVLVVSGQHVVIVLGAFLFAIRCGLLPMRLGTLLMMITALAYAMLTGADAPVVRATVIVELTCLAALWGRRVLSFNSLGLAAALVMLINPCDLFRSGVHLSFMCVLLLYAFGEWYASRTDDRPPLELLVASIEPWWIRLLKRAAWGCLLIVAVSAWVWMTALPLLLNAYHVATPVAVLLSLPLTFVVTAALLVGYPILIATTCLPGLAPYTTAPIAWTVDAMDGLVSLGDALPYGHFWTSGPATWWVLIGYAAAGALCYLQPRWLTWRRGFELVAVWTIVGCVPVIAAYSRGPQPLRCHILDVGHGACVVVETVDDRLVMYDAGTLGSPYAATETISTFLWSRGRTHIDAIVLSHADIDHFNAVPGLVDRFGIDVVFVSPHMFPLHPSSDDKTAPAALREVLDQARIPTKVVRLGDKLNIDTATQGLVLHPTELGSLGEDNANSLVLGLEARGRRVLLPGDLEAPGIDDLMADEPYDCDLLLAPHHGSKNSDPPGFSQWSQPEWVVISGSKDLGREVFTRSYAALGATILDTSHAGCVSFTVCEEVVEVAPFLPR